MDWELLQQQWDAQQETYMPDREERFTAMLDAVEAWLGSAPRVLDLAGGTGSISRRLLTRSPRASTVIVDVDPALLAIAAGSFSGDGRVRICRADLATPAWLDALGEPPGSFDAVLTATALHWLPEERVAAVYREAASLLRPGGLLANADHMADDGLEGSVGAGLDSFAEARTAAVRDLTGAPDWAGWWEQLAGYPELAAVVAERHARFAERARGTHTESTPPSSWHVHALRQAGFAHAGLVWRGLGDAVVVGVLGD